MFRIDDVDYETLRVTIAVANNAALLVGRNKWTMTNGDHEKVAAVAVQSADALLKELGVINPDLEKT